MPKLSSTPIEERFWQKVEKEGHNGCWIWTGAGNKAKNGSYGVIGRGRRGQGMAYAHRWSYEHACGPVPDGMLVLHHCDTPRCVNPEHLFLGTQKDNMQDAAKKGRTTKGERNTSSKFKDNDIRCIRRLAQEISHSALARLYGVSQPTISNIVNGKTWSHIPDMYPPRTRQPHNIAGAKLTEDAVRRIRRDAPVVGPSEAARREGVSPSVASRIMHGKAWSHVRDIPQEAGLPEAGREAAGSGS